ncbi:hypothetical protein MLD38_007381 [Melastoma candidum]|uniref:Uncharacterized protein n=1 Tax=Melastoma candidum TaxID=119954 RepID=A0ACB9RQL5_9MYRT|nr:hypothetical protein MLD38_007381 [Melastoma candidum]
MAYRYHTERKELIDLAEEERIQKEKEDQDRKEAEQKATEEKSKSAKDIDPETKGEVDEGGETKEDFDNDIVGIMDDPVLTAEGDGDAFSLPEIQEEETVSSGVVHDVDENAALDQVNGQGGRRSTRKSNKTLLKKHIRMRKNTRMS